MNTADLIQRLRARAANGASETGELLLEAAEALEQVTARTQHAADQDAAIREILAEQEETGRWFGTNSRGAWRTLRALRDGAATPEQRD